MKNDRYKLVGGGDLILDTLAYDNNHEKEGYLLLPHHYYPDDDYNYERDTYYALGGDDYDRWKENGGDLDGMMEGMGF